jgi:hypothetical protein
MERETNDETFLTRSETARLMRLAPSTLRNLAAMKPPQGPPYMKTARLRGRTLYRKSEVIAYMEGNGRCRPESAPAPQAALLAEPKPKPKRRKAASVKG